MEYRYYALFYFYSTSLSVTRTDKEKATLKLLGEFSTVRVIPCTHPDEVDPTVVWKALDEQGLLLPKAMITKGILQGQFVSQTRSWNLIDTDDPRYTGWQPHIGQLIDNPQITIEVTAC